MSLSTWRSGLNLLASQLFRTFSPLFGSSALEVVRKPCLLFRIKAKAEIGIKVTEAHGGAFLVATGVLFGNTI